MVSVEKVKTPDVWITVILGGLIAMMAEVIIVKLSQQSPEKTFNQFSREIVGKWVGGGLLSLLIVCYLLITFGFQVHSMEEVTGFYLLEGTSIWASTMSFIWVCLYLTIGLIRSPVCLKFIPSYGHLFLLVAFVSFGIALR